MFDPVNTLEDGATYIILNVNCLTREVVGALNQMPVSGYGFPTISPRDDNDPSLQWTVHALDGSPDSWHVRNKATGLHLHRRHAILNPLPTPYYESLAWELRWPRDEQFPNHDSNTSWELHWRDDLEAFRFILPPSHYGGDPNNPAIIYNPLFTSEVIYGYTWNADKQPLHYPHSSWQFVPVA